MSAIMIKINGVSKTLRQLSNETGIKYSTLESRYYSGCKDEDIIRPLGQIINHNTKLDEVLIISEERIKNKPSKLDIKESKQILRDFGIRIDIPDFQSVNQMMKWRKTIIDNYLDTVTEIEPKQRNTSKPRKHFAKAKQTISAETRRQQLQNLAKTSINISAEEYIKHLNDVYARQGLDGIKALITAN